jgi:hypothetical protein
MTKRKRATRQEMIERLEAKLQKLQAQAEGNFSDDQESNISKRLKKALRKRRTLLGRADVLLNGRPATEKSPAVNGIDEKIENAQSRLDQLIESKRRAEAQAANLPFDIEKLELLLEEVERGEEPEFPTDLFRIGTEKPTDREVEVKVAMGEEEDEE